MSIKVVHIFDAITGEYLWDYNAQASPLEPGKYLSPVHSTELPLPNIPANHVGVFANGVWATVVDFRGQTWFDQTTGIPIAIAELGQPAINLGVTQPFTPTLVTKKNLDINSWRQIANLTFFVWQTKQIACDPLSRSDIDGIAGYVGLYGVLPASFPLAWKAMDNSLIPVPDVPTFKSMYQAMVDAGAANFAHSQVLKVALSKATTRTQLDSIVW